MIMMFDDEGDDDSNKTTTAKNNNINYVPIILIMKIIITITEKRQTAHRNSQAPAMTPRRSEGTGVRVPATARHATPVHSYLICTKAGKRVQTEPSAMKGLGPDYPLTW